MQKFKIVVAYDGTDLHGWQVQPRHETVVSCLQNTFRKVFGHSITIMGASRTDSGVHALGQVAMFSSDISLDEDTILHAWNNRLPKSVVIRKIQRAPAQFYPLCGVLQKTYYYHLFLKNPLPFVARYGWFYRFIDRVNWDKFYQCLQIYVGEHDFAAFCKVEDEKSTTRIIDSIKMRKFSRFGVVQIEIKGKSFLRFQIRRMIGYALDVARRSDLSVEYLQGVLNSRDPRQTLLRAGGSGLCLKRVTYHDEFY